MIKDQLIIRFFKRTRLSHTVILNIALCFWFASMFFTTITVVHVNDFSYGWMTLLSGWLAIIFHLNPAWLANIFLFYIVTCYENVQKTLITPTIFAVLLSACTFFLHNIMISEMPAFAPIFGYGWGAILWFTSIYLIVIAVGLRLIKIASNGEDSTLQYDERTQGIRFLKLGVFLLISHTLLVTTKGLWDQTMASTWEKNRLSESNTIYKRGWVCRKEIRAKEVMKNFTGTLKVNLNPPNNIQPSHAYTSLDNPRFYLDEGISKVQIGDLEYQYYRGILKTQSKKSIPSAELVVSPLKIIKKITSKEHPDQQHHKAQLSLTLQNLLTKSRLFQETWEGSVSDDYINNFDLKKDYYFSLHECSQPDPKRLLINALNISQQPLNAPSKEHFKFKVLSLIPAEEVELKYRYPRVNPWYLKTLQLHAELT